MLREVKEDRRPTLLVVDDEPTNLQVLRQILQADYRLHFAKDGERALELAVQSEPDLILLDVMMPGMTGMEVCRQLKASAETSHIPVIFVTALSDERNEADGFEVGAVDYIVKPVSPAIVRARVRNHLSLVRMDDLRQSRLELVQRLGRAAEYKDNETGLHVMRMSHYARVMAKALGYDEDEADEMMHAAAMHDIGKIGIPDAIMLKNGPLTPEEWAVMRQHPTMGADIIGEHTTPLLQKAKLVALYHHEKWDGAGYPHGLKGLDIPLEGRIVAIAVVFDALTSERPYKKAWTVEAAVAHIQEQAGKHFDPELVALFVDRLDEILAIKRKWAD